MVVWNKAYASSNRGALSSFPSLTNYLILELLGLGSMLSYYPSHYNPQKENFIRKNKHKTENVESS